MNEIQIKKYELPKLEIIDYEKILKTVESDNEKYKGYIVTKETLDNDIEKRAELRKQAKAINDRRLEIDKELSKPIKDFKGKCDVLKNMYEESADLLDKQIKVFEEKERKIKKDLCHSFYKEIMENLQDIVSFEKVFETRWLNKGTKETEIKEKLNDIKLKVEDGLDAIKKLNSEFETELIDTFLQDFNITKAIFKNTQLLEKRETIKKVSKQQEETKEKKIRELLTNKIETEKIDPMKTYVLKITAPLSKQKKLKQFLDLNDMVVEKLGDK